MYGYYLFEGKIIDVVWEMCVGFNFGCVKIDGLNKDIGSEVIVYF